MKLNLHLLICIVSLILFGNAKVLAFDQYETMKVGETTTFYFPSEVTSRASLMYAYNCYSDHINNVEIVSYTNTSVTVKAIEYTQYTVNIVFDYWWIENNYGRTDTHSIHIDLYESGGEGGDTMGKYENPRDYDFDYGCWGTINIDEGESKTVYCQFNPPNPDKVRSIVWSYYDSYGYDITSQNSSACIIKGLMKCNNQKLWCLLKYGSTSYKAYYLVNVSENTKETISLSANPNGGKVEAGTIVTLRSSVSGANIYYTTNGINPTTYSSTYTSSGIKINESCTLKAFATKSGYNNSSVMTWVFTVEDSNSIEINATNFPDESFRTYLLSQSYGSDKKLTSTEISKITEIDVSGSFNKVGSIKSLKGIEYFTALKRLICSYNPLTSLDVSKNTNLTTLYCISNQLTSLDVSKNTALEKLLCSVNKIRGAEMDNLIDGLHYNTSGKDCFLYVLNDASTNEGNVCTKKQVAAARAKGWIIMFWDGESWKDYEGSDETISNIDGYKLIGTGVLRDNYLYDNETEVEIYQSEDNNNYFKILRPYDGITNDNKGDNYEGAEELELFILGPGWKIGDVKITLEDLVYYYGINTGYYYKDYGSYIYMYHPSSFFSLDSEEYWTYNKVLSYQNNGLPDRIQLAPYYYMDDIGGWDATQKDNSIIITFPKESSRIESVRIAEKRDTRIFDLFGRQLNKPQKGINIINGKKVFVK